MLFFQALFSQTFLQYAFWGGILASLACGIIGPLVVVRREGSIAGSIAHTVLGGMGIAYFLGKQPIWGAMIAAILAAIIIGWVSLNLKRYEDTIINALWATGMALGILFISKTPGYSADLMSYLFGNILLISQERLYIMIILDVVIALIMLLFYKQLVGISFDEEFTWLRGIHVHRHYFLFLCMVAVTTVILVQVVGLILVIALLTLPAAISIIFARFLPTMIFMSILLGCLLSSIGLGISYESNLPTGSTIILLVAVCYLFSLALKQSFAMIMRNK